MKEIFSNRIVSVTSSVLASVLAVALVGYAATTISTNINTAGTLTVSGASTLSGNIAADGGSATTTITGGLRADTADNTLVVDFSSSRVGIGTTSPSLLFSVTGNSVFGGVVNVTGNVNFSGSDATTTIAGGLGVGTTTAARNFSVGVNSLFGSADADIVSFRAGDVQFNSNATTTISTKNLRGINVNSGDLVVDTSANKLYVGTSTPTRGTLGVGGTGTTTLVLDSTSAAGTGGSCIELKTSDGQVINISASTTPTVACTNGARCTGYENLVVQTGACLTPN